MGLFLKFIFGIKNAIKAIPNLLYFMVLSILYSFTFILDFISNRIPIFLKFSIGYKDLIALADRIDKNGVSELYLVEIAFKNMGAKKNRSFITVGGMALGISFIVFLVSIGYGLQELVVTRVANLDELRQAEVIPGLSEDLALNDSTINEFRNLTDVEDVLPLIAVIGRVSYSNSISDMAVYGITTDYLKYSALKPIAGEIFDSNEISIDESDQTIDNNLIYAEVGQKISNVLFEINDGSWVKVYESLDDGSSVIGFTRNMGGEQIGEEYWGGSYYSEKGLGTLGRDYDNEEIGKWVKSDFYLWENTDCDDIDIDCEDGSYYVSREEDLEQRKQVGYIKEDLISLSKVAGAMDSYSSVLAEDVEVVYEDNVDQQVRKVMISSKGEREIVVNESVLTLLNIPASDAIGKVINITLVVTADLLEDTEMKIESVPVNYKIVGILADEGIPIIYIPFIDVRSLGVTKYSLLRVISNDEKNLDLIREKIEAAGYPTSSVQDTVEQIDSLFSSFRVLLTIIGLVALSVAALGMFNTLTISLMERTREVGLMKAMGIKSDEVRSLFLAESMIMGFYGGILGLIIGSLAGKLLSLFLSLILVFKNVGYIDVSYIPLSFSLIVIGLSILIGVITGYYPAKRSTLISALDALRYE